MLRYDMVEGFAYHWYSGDHFESLSMMHSKYPDKILMHSESCALHIPGKSTVIDITEELLVQMPEDMRSIFAEQDPKIVDFADARAYAHDIIGDLNGGMQRWIDWNMIVDRTGGPRHVAGGFAVPFVYEEGGTYTKTVSYEYLLLIAQTIRSGALRLGCSVWGMEVEAVAVKNPDGSIGLVLLNQAAEEKKNVKI